MSHATPALRVWELPLHSHTVFLRFVARNKHTQKNGDWTTLLSEQKINSMSSPAACVRTLCCGLPCTSPRTRSHSAGRLSLPKASNTLSKHLIPQLLTKDKVITSDIHYLDSLPLETCQATRNWFHCRGFLDTLPKADLVESLLAVIPFACCPQ